MIESEVLAKVVDASSALGATATPMQHSDPFPATFFTLKR
jgi:hypothetical protein